MNVVDVFNIIKMTLINAGFNVKTDAREIQAGDIYVDVEETTPVEMSANGYPYIVSTKFTITVVTEFSQIDTSLATITEQETRIKKELLGIEPVNGLVKMYVNGETTYGNLGLNGLDLYCGIFTIICEYVWM